MTVNPTRRIRGYNERNIFLKKDKENAFPDHGHDVGFNRLLLAGGEAHLYLASPTHPLERAILLITESNNG